MTIERLHLPTVSGPEMFDVGVRLLAVVFTLAAIILASRWLTELTAPRPVADLPSAASSPPEPGIKAVNRLFGNAGAPTQALEGLQLTGVFAGSRGGGFATMHTQTGDVSVFSGDEVAPGVILKQIEGDRVILFTSGTRKELRLHENNTPAAATPPPPNSFRRRPRGQGAEE